MYKKVRGSQNIIYVLSFTQTAFYYTNKERIFYILIPSAFLSNKIYETEKFYNAFDLNSSIKEVWL